VTLELKENQLAKAEFNIKVQNEAVKELAAKSEQARKQLETKNEEANNKRKEYDDRVAKILKLKVGATCEEALTWGVKQGQLQSAW
jgi:hypothetical protein